MKINKNLLEIVVASLTVAHLVGCSTTIIISEQNKLPAITTAEKVLEEWGSITASTPIVSIPSEDYAFKITKSADEYYESAKEEVNAGILQHTKTVFTFLLAASKGVNTANRDAYNEQLRIYEESVAARAANQPQTEEERESAKKARDAMLATLSDAAKENFEACNKSADAETELVTEETTADDAIKLHDSAVDRRKTCLDNYQAELSEIDAVEALSDFPTLNDNNSPSITRLQNTPFASKEDINADPFSLSEGGLDSALSLPDHTALPQAATNKFLADMLSAISDNKDKSAYFGVTMVSVNPGWRSKEGYHAVINIEPKIALDFASNSTIDAYLENKKIDQHLRALVAISYNKSCFHHDFAALCQPRTLTIDEKQVTLAPIEYLKRIYTFDNFSSFENLMSKTYDLNTVAISPVVYGQTQELQNRQISQINLSLMLAAGLKGAGVDESAEVFAEYSRQRRQELGSKNVDNAVSVFSSGSVVGVEAQPEFLAAVPGSSDFNYQLQQQTFPVLLRFEAIDQDAWSQPYIVSDCNEDDVADDICLLEPFFKFSTTSRWKPVGWAHQIKPWVNQLTTAGLNSLKTLMEPECDVDDPLLRQKCTELRSKLFGNRQFVSLPQEKAPEKTPQISHVYPTSLTLDRDAAGEPVAKKHTFVFLGENIKSLAYKQKDVTTAVKPVYSHQTVDKAVVSDGKLLVDMTISDAKGTVILTIDHKDKLLTTATNTAAIATLSVKPKQTPKSAASPLVIEVENTEAGIYKTTLPPTISDIPEQVSEVIQAISKQAKPVKTETIATCQATCKPKSN